MRTRRLLSPAAGLAPVLFAGLLMLALRLHGQDTAPDLEQLRQAFPDAEALFLDYSEHLHIGWEAGQLAVRRSHASRMLYLRPGLSGMAERALSYSGFSVLDSIQAFTLQPRGKRYRQIPVQSIRDVSAISSGIFFEDRREKILTFPAVEPGAIASLDYSESILEPRFLGAFPFAGNLPVWQSSLTVTTDTGIVLNYRLLGRDTAAIALSRPESPHAQALRWTSSRQPALLWEDQAPSPLEALPHVVVWVEQAGSRPLLNGPAGLYAWYRSLTDTLKREPGPEIRALVDELTAGVDAPAERAQRIFSWVQDHIRYIAFEEGLGGFVPRDADLVCRRKYGDCKDMSNLLYVMLRQAGLEAELCWLGTRDIPYRYDQVPTPLADNHMITALRLDSTWLFLDATDHELAFGVPSSFIQGKQAMIGRGEQFELVDVPVWPARASRFEAQAELQWSSGQLGGRAKVSWSGYPAMSMRTQIAGQAQDRLARFLGNRLLWGNNKFVLSDPVVQGLESRDAPIELQFNCSLPGYTSQVGDQVLLNLHLDRSLPGEPVDTARRRLPLIREFAQENAFSVIMQIPEGYRVAQLPAALTWDSGSFGFSVQVRKFADRVEMDRVWRTDFTRLEPDQFAEWNAMLDQLAKTYRNLLVLERIP
jgi:transglutaminase-like putative cysteine protease